MCIGRYAGSRFRLRVAVKLSKAMKSATTIVDPDDVKTYGAAVSPDALQQTEEKEIVLEETEEQKNSNQRLLSRKSRRNRRTTQAANETNWNTQEYSATYQ